LDHGLFAFWQTLFMARVTCYTCIYEPVFWYVFNSYVEALN
jgi:hypothetical protein